MTRFLLVASGCAYAGMKQLLPAFNPDAVIVVLICGGNIDFSEFIALVEQ